MQATDPREDPEERQRPGNARWYGLRLAFSDLRGTLSQAGPMLAEVTYADLGPVLQLVTELDRRTIEGRANLINSAPVDDEKARKAAILLADALTTIRARKLNREKQVASILASVEDEAKGAPEQFEVTENPKFAPLHFIKTAIRE
ncbi:MAG: hypothetical protein D6706_01500 [Chloroflexi bacterium]|nr:MAG: hypothetical protein D6706_01500 [Chloroflexota bacterium]